MKQYKLVIAIILIFVTVAGLATLSFILEARKDNSDTIVVVASSTQLHDITRTIGGDKVEVHSLYKPNVDPHTYQASAEDAKMIEQAKLIIQNGLGLESAIEELFGNVSEEQAVIVAGEYIDPLQHEDDEEHRGEKGHNNEEKTEDTGESEDHADEKGDHKEEDEHGHGEYDPHIWFSVDNMKVVTEKITEKLQEIDQDNTDYYAQNRDEYLKSLEELDTYIRDRIAEIPQEQRKIISVHQVLGYYARDYDLEISGSIIPNFSSEAQPSAKEVSELIKHIREENIKAIFTEQSIDNSLAEQIARETDASITAGLYTDSLGTEDSEAGTYIDMMKYNTEIIVNALK
ncbi:MAG: metal ABC transporter substrate-binding protein [Candidatus Dojkabacteria bacterium]